MTTNERNNDYSGLGRPSTKVKVSGVYVTLGAQKVFEEIQRAGSADVTTLTRRLRFSRRWVYLCLRELQDAGLLKTQGKYTTAGHE